MLQRLDSISGAKGRAGPALHLDRREFDASLTAGEIDANDNQVWPEQRQILSVLSKRPAEVPDISAERIDRHHESDGGLVGASLQDRQDAAGKRSPRPEPVLQ